MLELEHVDLKESEHNPVPISKEITPRSFKVLKGISINEEKMAFIFHNLFEYILILMEYIF